MFITIWFLLSSHSKLPVRQIFDLLDFVFSQAFKVCFLQPPFPQVSGEGQISPDRGVIKEPFTPNAAEEPADLLAGPVGHLVMHEVSCRDETQL